MHKEIALFIPQSGSRRMFSMAEQRSLAAMQSRRESDLRSLEPKYTPNPEVIMLVATSYGRKPHPLPKIASNGSLLRVATSNIH